MQVMHIRKDSIFLFFSNSVAGRLRLNVAFAENCDLCIPYNEQV